MILSIPFQYKCHAQSRLTVTSGAVVSLEAAKVTHPIYGPCQAIVLTVEDQSIRRTLDGITSPTTGADGVGSILSSGDILSFTGGFSIRNLLMIAVGADSVVQVDYFYEK
jgi:hypothetical protein